MSAAGVSANELPLPSLTPPHARRPVSAALSLRCLAVGGTCGSVVLCDVEPGSGRVSAQPEHELRPSLTSRVKLTLGVAADPSVTGLAFVRGGDTLLALCADGSVKGWSVAPSAVGLAPPRHTLSSSLPAPFASGMEASLLCCSDGRDGDGDMILTVHCQPAGWPAAGKLVLFSLRHSSVSCVTTLPGGEGPRPVDACASEDGSLMLALWAPSPSVPGAASPDPLLSLDGGRVAHDPASMPRLMAWSLHHATSLNRGDVPPSAAAAELLEHRAVAAAVGACDTPSAAAASALWGRCVVGPSSRSTDLATSPESPLAPGGKLEYTLVMSLPRRGVPLARAPLAAALIARGLPRDTVLAAATSGGPTPHKLLALAAEHVRACATRATGASGAQQVCEAFGDVIRCNAAAWVDTHHVLGLVHGGQGVVRTGCTSLLFTRAPEPREGAGDDTCAALAAAAQAVAQSLGAGACAALDDTLLAGAWAPSDALPVLASIARTGEARVVTGAATSRPLDDAGRAADKARHAALRVHQARMAATLSRLVAKGEVAPALRRLLRAALLPVTWDHAVQAGPVPWPATAAACAVTCAVAADVARTRADAARNVLLLCAVGAQLQPGGAFSDVLPEALRATQAALLALFLTTQPAAPGELPPDVATSLAQGRCLPCVPAAACEFTAWLADTPGCPPGSWATPQLAGAAGASLASHLLMASSASTAIPLARRVCTFTSNLYFQHMRHYQHAAGGMRGAVPAAETMLSLAASGIPPDGTDSSPFQASLCFLGGLVSASRAQAAMLLAASASSAAEKGEAEATHDEALCHSVALFSRAAVAISQAAPGVPPADGDLAALLAQVRGLMEAPVEVCTGNAVGYFRTLVLFFERCVDAPAAAYACTLAALGALSGGSEASSSVAALLWSNAFRHALACRRWRDAYTALLGVHSAAAHTGGGESAVREHVSRLVGAACDAGDGGQLLSLPWASPLLGDALDTALARRASGSATSQQAKPACQLLVASRIQAGQFARAAAALLAHSRRCGADQQQGRVEALRERCDALLHAGNCLRMAPDEAGRVLVERLPSLDASTWPPGVGCVPLPPAQPACGQGVESGITPGQLGYLDDADGEADMMEQEGGGGEAQQQLSALDALCRVPTDEEVHAALDGVSSGAGAMHALSMAAVRQGPVRVVTPAHLAAEYALLSAQAALPAHVVADLPGDCTDADADATVDALVAAALFGPAAALACAWYGDDKPAHKGAALERVVAALATRGAAGWVDAPAANTALGDAFGRTRGASPGTPAGSDIAWHALQRLLDAHAAAVPRLKSVAADAALRVSPAAPLPPWLVSHFTGGHGDASPAFNGAGGDVAELLRLYVRHSCLDAGVELALDILRRWDATVDPRLRASPSGCCIPYGALDALRGALEARSCEEGAVRGLEQALRSHVDLASRDAAQMASLATIR